MTKEETEKYIIKKVLNGDSIQDIQSDLKIPKSEVLSIVKDLLIEFKNSNSKAVVKALKDLLKEKKFKMEKEKRGDFTQMELENVAKYIINNDLTLSDSQEVLPKIFGEKWKVNRSTIARRLEKLTDESLLKEFNNHLKIHQNFINK